MGNTRKFSAEIGDSMYDSQSDGSVRSYRPDDDGSIVPGIYESHDIPKQEQSLFKALEDGQHQNNIFGLSSSLAKMYMCEEEYGHLFVDELDNNLAARKLVAKFVGSVVPIQKKLKEQLHDSRRSITQRERDADVLKEAYMALFGIPEDSAADKMKYFCN